MPRPKVASAVIRLDRYPQAPVELVDEKLFFQIVRASFNQRRKTLVNGLINGMNLGYTKEELGSILLSLGWKDNVRGEALTLEQFAQLSNLIANRR